MNIHIFLCNVPPISSKTILFILILVYTIRNSKKGKMAIWYKNWMKQLNEAFEKNKIDIIRNACLITLLTCIMFLQNGMTPVIPYLVLSQCELQLLLIVAILMNSKSIWKSVAFLFYILQVFVTSFAVFAPATVAVKIVSKASASANPKAIETSAILLSIFMTLQFIILFLLNQQNIWFIKDAIAKFPRQQRNIHPEAAFIQKV